MKVLRALVLGAICLAAMRFAAAQTYSESLVYSFCAQSGCTDGENPAAPLVQGTNGNLYGSAAGGPDGQGEIFELTPGGSLNAIYASCPNYSSTFSCPDGGGANALFLANDSNFYGSMEQGGSGGTLFRMNAAGQLVTLYNFCSEQNCVDGATPVGSLIQGPDGALYGVTEFGGASSTSNQAGSGSGTFFKITTQGGFQQLYSFCAQTNCADGSRPIGPVALDSAGNFYGVTFVGGKNNNGTVFKITSSGTLTTLYSFCNPSNGSTVACPDGNGPQNGLIAGADGSFYGVTISGGTNGPPSGEPGELYAGTVFKITPSGTLTTLYNFCAATLCADGSMPFGPLVQATDGNFYGVTFAGGVGNTGNGYGTVFQVSSTGKFKSIYSFCSGSGQTSSSCSDAYEPLAGLLQASSGVLYGTAQGGGVNPGDGPYGGGGAVYAISGVPLKQNPGITFTASPAQPSVGQTVTLTAHVNGAGAAPTGNVSFTANNYTLCSGVLANGQFSCMVSTNGYAPGSYTVTAKYFGAVNYNAASTSGSATLSAAPTQTVLTANPQNVTPPAPVTLKAVVSRTASGASGVPAGSVSFLYGNTVLGTVNLDASGTAALTGSTRGYSPGAYSITARYNGDTGDSKSTSAAVTVDVE